MTQTPGAPHPSGLSKGEQLTLACRDLTHDGRGVCKSDNFTLFVPGLLPGESGRVRITKLKKNWGEADLLERTVSAAARRSSTCPEQCGGCPLRVWEYTAQLQWKKERVIRALHETGICSESEAVELTAEPVPCEPPAGWRNKVILHGDRNGRFGFYAAGSRRVVAVNDCPMMEAGLRTLVKKLAGRSEPFRGGWLRELQLRAGDRLSAALLIRPGTPRPKILEGVKLLHSLGADNVMRIDRNLRPIEIYHGSATTRLTIGRINYPVTPETFFQVNTRQTGRLFAPAVECARQIAAKNCIDLYCGTGALTLQLAAADCRVTGIESNRESIRLAEETAQQHGLEAEFIAEKAESALARISAAVDRPDLITLDPPRAGCSGPVLEAIVDAAPRKIVYISCNPATLARDLAVLHNSGYRLDRVVPVDMFPDSAHIECIAELSGGTTE